VQRLGQPSKDKGLSDFSKVWDNFRHKLKRIGQAPKFFGMTLIAASAHASQTCVILFWRFNGRPVVMTALFCPALSGQSVGRCRRI
jgi:hypothetical protein